MTDNQQQPSSSDMLKERAVNAINDLREHLHWNIFPHQLHPARQEILDLIQKIEDATEALQSSAIPSMKWISVYDRLPNVYGMYHVSFEDADKNRYGGFIEFNEERGWLKGGFDEDWIVTEWLDESPASSSVIPHKQDNSVEP